MAGFQPPIHAFSRGRSVGNHALDGRGLRRWRVKRAGEGAIPMLLPMM